MLRFFILHLIRTLTWVYQNAISFDHGIARVFARTPRCKFHPTCSQYAKEALEKRGIVHGSFLTAWRLLRCNPWSKGGIDEP